MLTYLVGRYVIFIFAGNFYTHDLDRGWLEKHSNPRCFHLDKRDDDVLITPGECATLIDQNDHWLPILECSADGCVEPEIEFK